MTSHLFRQYFVFVIAFVVLFFNSHSAHTEGLTSWAFPGNGYTLTSEQLLGSGNVVAQSARTAVDTSSKGDGSYGIAIKVLPAILEPTISLSYNSSAAWNIEMTYGWQMLSGIDVRHPFPNERAYERDDLIVSGQISGVLKKDPSDSSGESYRLKTSSAAHVVAKYIDTNDDDTSSIKIYSNGQIFALTYKAGALTYRLDKISDQHGNYITYTYLSDGRLDRIEYGGNETSSPVQSHNVRVEFSYTTGSHVRTNFLGSTKIGQYRSMGNYLSQITIKSKQLSSESRRTLYTRQNAYVLQYTDQNSVPMLSAIRYEGTSSALAQSMVSFSYQQYDPASEHTATRTLSTDWPFSKSSVSISNTLLGIVTESESGLIDDLVDMTGDGLPDLVSSNCDSDHSDLDGACPTTTPWAVFGQMVDHTTNAFLFAPDSYSSGYFGINVGYEGLNRTIIDNLDEETDLPESDGSILAIKTTQDVVDFDGDGIMDFVRSDLSGDYYVSYGQNVVGMGLDSPITESGPGGAWLSIQTNYSYDADDLSTGETKQSGVKGMMDVNGDGWQDLLDPTRGTVYFHTGTRGGGWDTNQTNLNLGNVGLQKSKFTIAVRAEEISMEPVVAACGEFCETTGNLYSDNCTWVNDTSQDGGHYECAFRVDGEASSTTTTCQTVCDSIASSPVAENYIAEEKIVTRFIDLNGDSLPDYVDATSIPWRVSFGYGNGQFTEPVEWGAPVDYLSHTDEGYPSVNIYSTGGLSAVIPAEQGYQFADLVDVDGDGLLDFVGPGSANSMCWYKNLGDGFDTTSRDLPGWWPNYLRTFSAHTNSWPSSIRSEGTGVSVSDVTEWVSDIDHDGMPDVVSSTGIEYGQYPRPYLLKSVDMSSGSSTTVDYRNAATLIPSGDGVGSVVTMSQRMDVVNSVRVEDTVSGKTGQKNYDYENGTVTDGMFTGFTNRSEQDYLDDVLTAQTFSTYELNTIYEPLITSQRIQTDINLSFGDAISKGSSQLFNDRYFIEYTYADWGDYHRLLNQKYVTEYGEVRGSATSVLEYQWDEYGNMTYFEHDGGGVSADAFSTSWTYGSGSYDLERDFRYYKVVDETLSGYDPLNGDTPRQFKHMMYYFDDNTVLGRIDEGLRTTTRTITSWFDGGEWDSADGVIVLSEDNEYDQNYSYGSRGELLSATDLATGITMSQTYGFGDVVVATQTNGLGQTLTNSIDSKGRIYAVTDPNGFKSEVVFDSLDRITAERVTAGGTRYTLSTNTYSTSTTPFFVAKNYYDGTGTSVDFTNYAVLNGFGDVAQFWMKKPTSGFSVSDIVYDAAGQRIYTEHPENVSRHFLTTATVGMVDQVFRHSYYDGLGNMRETKPDENKGLGSVRVYFDEPRQERRIDPDGYETKLTYDAHHRIIRVEQGSEQSGASILVGEYRYDPLGNLVQFTDAIGNDYTYSYDGAGRLRETKYGSASVPLQSWYTYSYLGNLLQRVEANTGGYSEWTYDAIGRKLTQTVSDGLASSPYGILGTSSTGTTYTWTYDTKWIGMVSESTDPLGSHSYEYDDFGRVTESTRTNSSGVSSTHTTEYDVVGRPTQQTFPSGYSVVPTYTDGWLTRETGLNGGVADFTVDYTYNKWGGIKSATNSNGMVWQYTHTTPAYIDQEKLQSRSAGTRYQRDYVWSPSGLLQEKTITNGTSPAVTYSMSYNDLKMLANLSDGTNMVESYTYDNAGNLTAMTDANGAHFTYAPASVLGQIDWRYSDTGIKEEYCYDSAGRLEKIITGGTCESPTTVASEYDYDGLNRLRAVQSAGAYVDVLDYAADGALVRQTSNDPFGSTALSYLYKDKSWEYDGMTVTENYSGLVGSKNNARTWNLSEKDGNSSISLDDAGVATGTRQLGVYGSEIAVTGDTWDSASFHGAQKDSYAGNLYHFGQRHLNMSDGTWLQPEPLLYQGLSGALLSDPLRLAPRRYARNNSFTYSDRSGNIVETPWDALCVSVDVGFLVYDVLTGAPTETIEMDLAALTLDVAATFIPGAPGGGAVAVSVGRAGGYAVRSEKAADLAGTVYNMAVKNGPVRGATINGAAHAAGDGGPGRYGGGKRLAGAVQHYTAGFWENLLRSRLGMAARSSVTGLESQIRKQFRTSFDGFSSTGRLEVVKGGFQGKNSERKIPQVGRQLASSVSDGVDYTLAVEAGSHIPDEITAMLSKAGESGIVVELIRWEKNLATGELRIVESTLFTDGYQISSRY